MIFQVSIQQLSKENTMRIALLLFSLVAPICADLFTWDDSIFPPDQYKSLDEKKMKPMVSHSETAFSGANTVTSLWAMDRTSPALMIDKSSSGGWDERIKALEKIDGIDYKDR